MFGFTRKARQDTRTMEERGYDQELYYGLESGRINLSTVPERIADWFYGVQAGRLAFPRY